MADEQQKSPGYIGAASLKMLSKTPGPTKYYPQVNNTNEVVKREITELIDNFERTFIGYINKNYNSFTENDV